MASITGRMAIAASMSAIPVDAREDAVRSAKSVLTIWTSGLQPLIVGIVSRFGNDPRRMAGAKELKGKFATRDGERGLDIGEGKRLADRVTIGTPGRDADQPAVMMEGLVAAAVGIGGVDLEIDELETRPLLHRLERTGLADKLLAEIDKALHRSFDHADLVRQLPAPGPIGLLHAQRVHGIGAEQPDAVPAP